MNEGSLEHILRPSVPAIMSSRTPLPTREEIENYVYSDYWELFVLKHQQPHNITFHMIGVILFYGIPITALYAQNPWLLCWMPLSPTIGLIGHWVFERSNIDLQDAILSARTVRCFNKMFYRVLIGKYIEDIQEMNVRFLNQVKKTTR